MVFFTALATTVFGLLIDFGHSIESISTICAFYVVVATAIIAVFQKSYNPVLINKTWFLFYHNINNRHGKSYSRRLYR